MPRYINPIPQYFTNGGKVLSGGTVEFFKSQTSSPLTTFADSLLTIPNTNPVVLDAAGRLPNVFFEGSAKIIIKDSAGGEIKEVDPVGGENVTGEFELFDLLIIYSINGIVKGSDGKFYISLVDANSGNDPVTPNPTKWSEFRLIGVYNAAASYSIGDVVQESTGLLWRSLTGSNLGNTPNTDNGTNWVPAVDGSKIAEIITLETRTTTVIPQTGGGTLTALRTNELRDADLGYLLPLANSVSVNQEITINLPERYATGAIVTRSGGDTIEGATSDTSITFAGATSIKLTSDGVSKWTL